MKSKTLPLTQKDFAWVKWTGKQMKVLAKDSFFLKKENYKKIKAILPEKRTFENTIFALDHADNVFADVMNKLAVLSDISPSKETRDAAHKIHNDITPASVDLDYDRDLYISVLEYYEGNFTDEKRKLTKEDIKLLEDTIKEYRRAGFDLPDTTQQKFKSLLKKSIQVCSQFQKNLVEYNDYMLCTKEELAGLPERVVSSFSKDSKTGKYKVTLQIPDFGPFMIFATNRKKREELAKKSLMKGGKKNLVLINKLTKIRHQMATLLGYKHHADFRTENRMAKNARTALDFQEALLKELEPKLKKERTELVSFSRSIDLPKLEHYDMSFAVNALKRKLFTLDSEIVREYFPLQHVKKEMFTLFSSLYGLIYKKLDIPLWHKDAELFEVRNKDKTLVGYFVLDLYARPEKSSHYACLFDAVMSYDLEFRGETRNPAVGVILCNFSNPTKKLPSLLPIRDVEALFHEFGHCMHLILSKVGHKSQSGTNVAWDFVETPSQLHENWVWHDTMLQKLSKHYKTGKKLPKDMRENLMRSKLFRPATVNMGTLIAGIIELKMHMGLLSDATATFRLMNKKYMGVDLPKKETLFPAGFGHMAGYDAGFYSYLWSLVYAQDVFSEFEKKGIFDSETGMKWRREVLEKGSSEDEMKLLRNFLGRKPNNKAFLKELGI
jgi:thimet oligopeptidase